MQPTLGPASPGLGKNGTDEPIEPCTVGGDWPRDLRLLIDEGEGNLGEAALDPLVHGHGTADEGADAGIDLGVEGSGIAAGNLNAGEFAGTTRGQMLTP